VTYQYVYGDGAERTRPIPTVSHTYENPGTYTLTLTVTDTAGQTDSVSSQINVTSDGPGNPPTAAISLNTNSGSAPLTVIYDASDSAAESPATLSNYSWQLGNGDTATSIAGSTTYTQAGTYTINLSVTDSAGLSDSETATITVSGGPVVETSREAAARLLAQATFGPTFDDIENVVSMGMEAWIDDQFERQGESHLAYVQRNGNNSANDSVRQDKWWIEAVEGEDQLRQRVAFALSEILVVSDIPPTLDRAQQGIANYFDILSENAFGNFRDLLETVTLSPVMGLFLDMIQNAKADPEQNTRADENFAREVIQLFTIGLHELNPDGTKQLNNNQPIPAYTQAEVEEYAKVFTGWNYAGTDNFSLPSTKASADKISPMQADPRFHDTSVKVLLGGVIAPGNSAEADLAIALDTMFNHPNVGPFIGKQLIQRLVTSNPSPDYVDRISSVFNNNGSGERGDLRAVIRAILLDPEAREGHLSNPNYGKLREPLLRMTHVLRAFNLQRGRSAINQEKFIFTSGPPIYSAFGQGILKSPSVFNFFSPDYSPLRPKGLRENDLVAPEAALYSDSLVAKSTSKIATQILKNLSDSQAYLNITPLEPLATSTDGLLDYMDLVMMSGQMSNELRGILFNHLENLAPSADLQRARIMDAIALIAISHEYLVQK